MDLGRTGFSPEFGARPLKRILQKELLNRLAVLLLQEKFESGDKIVIDVKDGNLAFLKK